MIYYTYHIYWTNLNKHYYGVRGTMLENPKMDLWINYFTSSKYVKMYRKENGEPDLIEIRKIFSQRNEALKWEQKVLVRIRAVRSSNWLNRYSGSYHGAPGPKNHGWKISRTTKGRKQPRDVVDRINKNPEKIRKTAEKHRGQKRSEQAKINMSNKRKQILREHGGALNKGHKMFFNPENTKQQIQCLPENAPINWVNGNPTKKGKRPYINISTKTIKWFKNDDVLSKEWIIWNPNKKEFKCL